jgi:hypothetical protein
MEEQPSQEILSQQPTTPIKEGNEHYEITF